MKKRTHALTLSYFEISSYPCCGGFFCSNKIGSSTQVHKNTNNLFFSLFRPLTPKYSSLSLSLSLSLSFFYYRVTKRSTHPAAGEKEKRKNEETRVENLLLALLFHRARSSCSSYAAISYVFFLSQKQDNKSQREKKRKKGG